MSDKLLAEERKKRKNNNKNNKKRSKHNNYIIVTDMEGNIRIYRLPKGHGTDQGNSVYPDVALYISIYCVYCIEDQNLTHTLQYKCIEIFNQDH